VTLWESYTANLHHADLGPERWFRNLAGVEERAEDGYYRCSFDVGGPTKFLDELFICGLGRHVEIRSKDGTRILWEGKIFEMGLKVGDGVTKISLVDVKNAVWIRYRVTGTSTTLRSTVFTDAASIARFSRIEYPVNAGELENSSIADQAAQVFLKRLVTPKQWKDSNNDRFRYDRPVLSVMCRGYADTWNWLCYDQTAVGGSQIVSAEISDIATAKFAYAAKISVDTNNTLVSKVYDTDDRAGNIVRNCSKLGDPQYDRWLARMESGRLFRYKQAAPGVIPPSA
jgi:hypothetical protein